MQGTRVRDLVPEDPTCRGATKSLRRNYWACALEPASHVTEPARLETVLRNKEKPPQWEARVPQWRVAPARGN